MTILETSLAGLTVGTPVTHANLTMFPLLGGAAGEPAYLTLGEALAAGQARVTEVSEQGSVPELKLVNGAARLVGFTSGVIRHFQSGYVYHYAFTMIVGVFALLTWWVGR